MNSVYRIFGYENGLEHDVIEFLELLCSKGFIISGSTEEECANGRFEFKVLTNESRNQEKGNSLIETQTFYLNVLEIILSNKYSCRNSK